LRERAGAGREGVCGEEIRRRKVVENIGKEMQEKDGRGTGVVQGTKNEDVAIAAANHLRKW
jgi:hypothetical protein